MARQINNANVAKKELENVGDLKDLERHDSVWQARFETGVLNFQKPYDIVTDINVLHIYPDSDVEMGDTIVVNLTFDI